MVMDLINDVAEVKRLHAETEVWIDKTLDSLGWSRENLLKDELEKRPCGFDSGHMVPGKKLDQHEWYCSRTQCGYSRHELDADQSSKFFYEKATTVVPVALDGATLRRILSSCSTGKDWSTHPLPLTSERYLSDLNAEERRAIYDYCVATGKATNKMITFPKEQLMLLEDQDDKTDDQNKDVPEHLRQLMQERDMKRKRQKYRAKNVHITQKSHTEIIREVLANQMELLHRRWIDEEKAKRESIEKEDKFHSEKDSQHSRRSRSHRPSDRKRRRSRESESGADDVTSRKRRRRSKSQDGSSDRHRSEKHRHKHHKHKHHKHSRRHDDRDHDNDTSHKSDVSTGVTAEENSLKVIQKEDVLSAFKKEELEQDIVAKTAHAT
ncbi:U11/U12 small nuclear ribonucleoprotein 48 kDa protein [Lamellibrachia satsuma]|nr:U11/U12 small nuclear ribonucleoprotein 48 kDa protein [Lamellibrachia satsuma]